MTMNKVLLITIVVVVIFGIHFIANLFFRKVILNKVSKRKETIFLLIINLIKYGGLLVGLFVILAVFGVDTASVLAGAGLLGILLGFGLQKLMQDMIKQLVHSECRYHAHLKSMQCHKASLLNVHLLSFLP